MKSIFKLQSPLSSSLIWRKSLFGLPLNSYYTNSALGFSIPAASTFSSFYNTQNFTFTNKAYRQFIVRDSKDTGRSQRGIFAGKRPGSGYRKCFSMKHHLRKFDINVFTKKIRSDFLEKDFYLQVSSKALRTIKLYGGLDNYLLKSNSKKLEKDSQLSAYLRRILLNKTLREMSPESKKQQIKILRLKHTRIRKVRNNSRKKQKRRLPSIFYPKEYLRKDMSHIIYPKEKFYTRKELEEKADLEKELSITTDLVKKEELSQRLEKLQKEDPESLIEQVLSLQPLRHKDIRDHFMKIKNKFYAKINYLEVLKESENLAKAILKERYRHFSEDYPEIQLLLQKTEQQRQRKERSSISKIQLRNTTQQLGEIKDSEKGFSPYAGKHGRLFDMVIKFRGNRLDKFKERRHKTKELNKKLKRQQEILGGATPKRVIDTTVE